MGISRCLRLGSSLGFSNRSRIGTRAVVAWNWEPLQQCYRCTLACAVHDEYTIARGSSARHCPGLLTVSSCDAQLLVGYIRCFVCIFRFSGKCWCMSSRDFGPGNKSYSLRTKRLIIVSFGHDNRLYREVKGYDYSAPADIVRGDAFWRIKHG